MEIKIKAYIFIMCSLIGGALFPIALKVAAGSNVNIYAFIFLAYLIAAPVSLLLVFARGKTQKLKGYIKNPKEYLLIGIVGFTNLALVDYGLFYAEKFVSASLATVVYRMQPLLMLLFIPFLLRERVSKIQIAALMLAFAGIYIALSGGSLSIFSGADTGIVSLLVVITLISAFSTVFLKRYTTDMESTMFIFNSVALVISAALFLYSGAQLPALNASSTIALLFIGIVVNTAVPFFYYSGFRTLKTTFVTNLYCLSPFLTVLFAGLILQEPIYPYYLAIAVLVAVGIVIQRFDKNGGTYVAKTKQATKSYPTMFDVTSAFLNTKVDAIHATMKGNGRVLAVKMKNEEYATVKQAIASGKIGNAGIIYTNYDNEFVSPEENSFITGILGAKEGETVLMSAGSPEESEKFFGKISLE